MLRKNMEAVQFNAKLGEAPWLHSAEVGEDLGTWFSGNLYDDGAATIEQAGNHHVLGSKLSEPTEGSNQNEDLTDFGWMEAPMDLELFEQSLTPLFDDSFLAAASTPETFSNNQVSESNVKPDEQLYDTLELMLKQLQNEEIEVDSPSSELYPSLSGVVDDTDAVYDVASDLLDALMQGKMEENATLVELADIAFEWMETAIPAEAPSAPSSPEELPQSPTCSGSFTTTDTESSQSSEWEEAPKKAPRLSPSSRSSKTTSVAAAAPKATSGRGRKARIRPEERLLRKKEQNKTAATRYREKKKMELGVAHEQQMELENQNRKLKRQHDSLVQELRFMKKLARDVFRKSSISK